ncbi:MAG TPA: DciA family protein [Lacunisphaera sp.]
MSQSEPKEFSRAVENLIAGLRDLPEDTSRSRNRRASELTSLIDELLVKHRISHDSVEHSIREKWAELVGVANAAYSHPLVVEKKLLVVLVSHAVVRNELFLHKDAIVEKLRKLPGCTEIKGLALRSG